MHLSEPERQHYFNLIKGYEGEKIFDSLTEKLRCECYVLNDLLLKCNKTIFQIDSLIITEESILLYEVKNYGGDFYYEGERLYKLPQAEITNPLIQLNRNESLLRQLLQSLGYNMTIQSNLVFINPEFTLYQAPLNLPFIFPAQLHRHFNKLNSISSKLNNKHKQLAETLISLHLKESPYTQLPYYNYDHLKKGITCKKCSSFLMAIIGKKCICKDCGLEEKVAASVIRSVKEFKLLFPDQKITTNYIYDWCKVIESKQRIRRILEKNFKKTGVHQWAFYE